MSDFDAILAFTRVVELESYTKAARRLGISKSIVSRRVARLEKRLGAQLLVRSTRGLTPTEPGRAFAERAARSLAELQEAEVEVKEGEREPSGALRIAAPLSFGIMHLGPALIEFAERHPRIVVDAAYSDRYVDLVEDSFDAAVRIGALSDSSLGREKALADPRARRGQSGLPGPAWASGSPARSHAASLPRWGWERRAMALPHRRALADDEACAGLPRR